MEEGLLRKRVAEYGSSDELAEDMWFRRAVVHKRCSNKFDSQKLVRLRKERSSATSSYVGISIFWKIGSTVRKFYDRKKNYLLYIDVGNCVRTNDTSISSNTLNFTKQCFICDGDGRLFIEAQTKDLEKTLRYFGYINYNCMLTIQ